MPWIFGRGGRGRGAAAEPELDAASEPGARPRKPLGSEGPAIVSIASIKGGVGKSMIAVESAVLASIADRSAMILDLDLTNMSATSIIKDSAGKISDDYSRELTMRLLSSESPSFLKYLLSIPEGGIEFIVLDGSGLPKYALFSDPRKGRSAGKIFLLPPKPSSPPASWIMRLSMMASDEVSERVARVAGAVRSAASSAGVRRIFVDLPSLEWIEAATHRYSGVKYVLEYSDMILVVAEYTDSSSEIAQLVRMLKTSLSYLSSRIAAVIVNKVPDNIALEESAIYRVLSKNIGAAVYGVSFSGEWIDARMLNVVPGMLYPSAASEDLINLLVDLGVLDQNIYRLVGL